MYIFPAMLLTALRPPAVNAADGSGRRLLTLFRRAQSGDREPALMLYGL
jgi:hypothetical protein